MKPFINYQIVMGVCAILISGGLSGCITDATTDLTKAPFDASTELSNGITDATTALTEPTREFISSTTPGAWFRSDGTLNPKFKPLAFVILNFDNLQEDMAHGSGEYLASLSALLGLSPKTREAFGEYAQRQYGYVFQEGQSRKEALQRLIQVFPALSVS